VRQRRIGSVVEGVLSLAPSVALCVLLTLAANVLGRLETVSFGRAWIEPIALSILLGTIVRTVWTPSPVTAKGVAFAGKTILEVAIVFLAPVHYWDTDIR
jgi:uncharacterized membrane protein YadS